MTTVVLLAVLLSAAPAGSPEAAAGSSSSFTAAEALAAGDAAFSRRAEGAKGATCDPAQVEAALAAYRRAMNLDQSSYPARLGFLRAVYFRGGFCPMADGPKIALYEEAKRVAEATVKRLQSTVDVPGKAARRREVLRREPLAAEIYLWAAVSWGQWAVDHKVAAAWQGAAGVIRDLAQAVVDIDPATLDGGAYLILGRLHTEAPRIPLVTGWVSRARGLEYLRRGMALAPDASNTLLFLGKALLDDGAQGRNEARAVLLRGTSLSPRANSVIEDLHYIVWARQLLVEAKLVP
jgi:hypothetical protein